MSLSRKDQRVKRHTRLRKKISGTAEVPRMAVFTSEKHLYVQFIDDVQGKTLASTSTVQKDAKDESAKANLAGASIIGRLAAEKAKAAGIEKVVFDRGGFAYQGRIQAIADAAREAGLKF